MSSEFIIGVVAFLLAFHFGVLPVSSTSYERIRGVSINSYARVFVGWVLWVPNRLVGPFVVIHRSGLAVLMTPAKPEEFARELSMRVQERTGEWPLA